MRPIYLDDEIRPDMNDQELLDADVDVFERAMDAAREHHARQADLERRATTDPAAALEVVKQRLHRYQLALLDGTDREKQGEKELLRQACAHFNALTGRVPVGQTTEAVA